MTRMPPQCEPTLDVGPASGCCPAPARPVAAFRWRPARRYSVGPFDRVLRRSTIPLETRFACERAASRPFALLLLGMKGVTHASFRGRDDISYHDCVRR